MNWFEQMRLYDAGEMLTMLGHQLVSTEPAGRYYRPCPSCGAQSRTSRDNRLLWVRTSSPTHWKCLSCGARGDAIDLVSYDINGCGYAGGSAEQRQLVASWCKGALGASVISKPALRALPTVQAKREHVPQKQVAHAWSQADKVAYWPKHIIEWIHDVRGIDPDEIDIGDLARVWPVGVDVPYDWMSYGWEKRAWPTAGLRLLVPMVNVQGELRGLTFRRIGDAREGSNWPPKSVGATGYSRARLVFADDVTWDMLRDGAWPARHDGHLTITEGEMDYLAHATHREGCLGVISGSWSKEYAERLPSGTHVHIATDDDEAGRKYAQFIWGSLRRRNDISMSFRDCFYVADGAVRLAVG